MTRPLRIEYEGAFYHIFSRGNDQQDIFLTAPDRFSFLKALGQMAERFDMDIFAYVLMDNHYHLLIRTNIANLSKSMQWLGTTYTTRFNLRHKRSGHLFQGRYKSIIVENDAYLLQLSCYIHRNPLRAGLVERLADYRWSSYPVYAYKKHPPEWLNTELILSQFTEEDNHRAYRRKVQKYSDEEKRIGEDIKHGLVYGTQSFVDRIKKVYLNGEASIETSPQVRRLKNLNLSEIIEVAAGILDFDLQELRQSRRISVLNKGKRDLLVYFLWQTGYFRNSEIGSCLGLTYSSVSRRVKIFQEQLDQNNKVRNEYEKIKSQIKV